MRGSTVAPESFSVRMELSWQPGGGAGGGSTVGCGLSTSSIIEIVPASRWGGSRGDDEPGMPMMSSSKDAVALMPSGGCGQHPMEPSSDKPPAKLTAAVAQRFRKRRRAALCDQGNGAVTAR
jgi:hypothetical protein